MAVRVTTITKAFKTLSTVFDHKQLVWPYDLQHVIQGYPTTKQVSDHEHSCLGGYGLPK